MTDRTNNTRKRMKGSIIWFLVAALAAAGFSLLGMWQLDRKAYKEQLLLDFEKNQAQAIAPQQLQVDDALLSSHKYATANLKGRFDSDHQLLLDNQGKGFHVWTPFAFADSIILVNRGWIPWGATRAEHQNIAVDEAERQIVGRLAPLPISGVSMGASIPATSPGFPKIVVYPTHEELQQLYGPSLRPYLLWLDEQQPDGYRRDWKPIDMPPERHLGYAVQWFSLAFAVLVIFTLLTVRSARKRTQEGDS